MDETHFSLLSVSLQMSVVVCCELGLTVKLTLLHLLHINTRSFRSARPGDPSEPVVGSTVPLSSPNTYYSDLRLGSDSIPPPER